MVRSHPETKNLIVFSLSILYSSLFACTIGAFSPSSTREIRPILWKNRDVHNPDQEMKLFTGERFRFIANVYAGETLDVWAGINEAGFAIMNSNSYNLPGANRQGFLHFGRNDEVWGRNDIQECPMTNSQCPMDSRLRGNDRQWSGADDGRIMRIALGTCATVADFARLMDSFNIVGRQTPANFGVFDASGKTVIFEASNTYWTVYDAQDDSLGFLLRANFSMSGGQARLLGKNRFERAMELCVPAVSEKRLSVEFIVKNLCRDLGQVGFNPYPLPFLSRLEPLPYGYLPTDTTICRNLTRSVEIMVGPEPNKSLNTSMIWVLLGAPIATLPIPLWIKAGKIPKELDGHLSASICDEAQRLRDFLYPLSEFPNAINTFRLAQWLDHIAPVESTIFDLVARHESIWGSSGPDSTSAAGLTEEICTLVLRTYQDFYSKIEPERATVNPFAQKSCPATILYSSLDLPGNARVYDVSGRKAPLPLSSGLYFQYARYEPLRVVFLR